MAVNLQLRVPWPWLIGYLHALSVTYSAAVASLADSRAI